MIGRRLRFAGVALVAIGGLTLMLGGGGPRPEIHAAARRLVVEAADTAHAALTELTRALEPAVDAGRAGSARAIAGDEAPGPKLSEAAELTRVAVDAATDARRALLALDRARRAADPEAPALELIPEPGEIESIATQLEASAEAADEFATMRARADAVVAELDAALVALDAGNVEEARRHATRARDHHSAIAEWDVGLVTLPVWVDTTDAMIDAMEQTITATGRGEAAAAEQAADAVAALSDDAVTADRALRIAMGEGGSAVASVPLARLAAVLAAAANARTTVASIRGSVTP